MSWKDMTVIAQQDAGSLLDAFSSSCRRRFGFLKKAVDGHDLHALRQHLLGQAVDSLLMRCPMDNRTRASLKRAPPEGVINSLAKDAERLLDVPVAGRIRKIRSSLSVSVFEKLNCPFGADTRGNIPIYFWVQTGKGGVPYLRVWAGFRSFGARSHSAFPRSFLKEVISAKRAHLEECHSAEVDFVSVSFDGSVYALSVESSFRFWIPLTESQREKYEVSLARSNEMNGRRVQHVLGTMLHEIVCPLGIDLPVEPNLACGLVRDRSPLDRRYGSRR